MIYFAIFPTVMTMRSSNPVKHAEEGAGHPTRHWWKYIRAPSRSDRQFLKQLFTEVKAHDNWFMFFSTLTVMVIEMFETKIPDGFVSVLVESISAYSNVGVSMGVPSDGYSFSGSMNWPSRISLCVVMLQGKFRSLPVATDMATVNHSEEAATVEEHDVETGIEAAQDDPDQETYEESTRASWPERVDSMAKQPGSVDIQDIAQEGMIS
uniref:Uncharacterized protein n=1 Tax=Ramularia collo-cygni TaxID=112498 RepID=A0A2D3V5M2_9PEZI